jgi:hypothetical protein
MNTRSPERLTDEQLLVGLQGAAAHERGATTELIALLAEMDARKLYLAEGYSSLFVYCTRCLHLSEHAAYGRIEAARAARRFPLSLELLADGSISLTTVCLLAGHLTPDNHRDVLEAARHKTKREVEEQVAALRPLPAVASLMRRLPHPKDPQAPPRPATQPTEPAPQSTAAYVEAPGYSPLVPSAQPVMRPLSPERYKVQVTINRETHDKIRKIQTLLRHVIPNGDLANILDRAVTLLLQDVERRRLATVDRPSHALPSNVHGRHVPAAVKREVWARDDGRCAFIGTRGRCDERGFLEFHHVIAFADGGPTTADNLQLRCRAHNAYEARELFADP